LRKLFFSLLLGYALIATIYAQNPVDSAQYFYNEYIQSRFAGDFVRSEFFLKRILEEESLLTDFNVALVRNNLGYVYYETGRYQDALEQYRMAESLLSGTEPGTLQLKISIHINQAIYHGGLGDYTNALEYNNQALRLLELLPLMDSSLYGKLSALLLNKGIALYQLERYEEALEILKESERIKVDHNLPYLGSVYFNQARVNQSLGNLETSGQFYLKGIDRWISEYDSAYYELANLYLYLGQLLSDQEEDDLGFGYLQKALQNYKGNYGIIHPLTAGCYEKMAQHCLDFEDYEKAFEYLQLALQSISGNFEEKGYFSNPDVEYSSHDLTLLRILATKAKALEGASEQMTIVGEKMDLLKAALTTNLLSIDVLHRIQDSFLSGESRISLNSQQKNLFTTGIRLNLEMFKLTGNEIYKEDAFLSAARGKSNELMYEMKMQEWLYLESLSNTKAIHATELKQQIDHLSNLIQIQNMEMTPDSVQLATWQKKLFQTRDSFNRHMEDFRREFPQIGHFESTNSEFSMAQIRRNLNRNETLVEYFMAGTGSAGPEQLFIFVVSRDHCDFYQSTIDSVFHLNLETITQNLHHFDPYSETFKRYDSLKVALFGFYRDLIEPVESFFIGEDLVIVPDELLSSIPFDALITHLKPETIINYAGLPYLMNDYTISYMYNSQLIERKHPQLLRVPRVTAWIPEHNASPDNGSDRLQGAVEEVRDILEVVKGNAISNTQEKREVVRLLQEKSIIHLAMHSLATENGSGSPYFVLDTVEDPLLVNRVYDYEINALQLTTPLVVLSSCETAVGKLQNGEGIMSLSRSFLQAGAKSVVHTLWPVEDIKSRDIMIGFYGEMKRGHSKSSALSSVKKQYLKSHPPFYTHPYYWAAFQITGDTSPLYSKWRIGILTTSILLICITSFYLARRNFFRRD